MFDKDYRRRQAPSSNGINNRYLFPILGVFFIVSGLTLKFLALGLPWFALIINFIAKWTIALCVACLVPTVWRCFVKTKDDLQHTSKQYDLSFLKRSGFDQKLFSMHIYEKDSYNTNKIRFPRVEITNYGFKLSAIGKLRKQLLDDETIGDFNSYLALHNANCQIQSAYYRDGYVHYVVRHSIGKDRLHF